MTIRHCLQLANLVSLLSSLYFLKHPYLPKEPHHLLHLSMLSQQCPYVTLNIMFLSAVPPLHQYVFQACGFHMLHFCMLVVGYSPALLPVEIYRKIEIYSLRAMHLRVLLSSLYSSIELFLSLYVWVIPREGSVTVPSSLST